VRSRVRARDDNPCVSRRGKRDRESLGRLGDATQRQAGDEEADTLERKEISRGRERKREEPKSNEQNRQASLVDNRRRTSATRHDTPAWISPECGGWSTKSAEARRRGWSDATDDEHDEERRTRGPLVGGVLAWGCRRMHAVLQLAFLRLSSPLFFSLSLSLSLCLSPPTFLSPVACIYTSYR